MVQTVLVTGVSGFIAAHVVDALLRKGYNVRGTVRSEQSASGVLQTHSKYPGQVSISIVPDITAPNAFGEAVQDVDGIIHSASPFILDATDFDGQLFQPAIQGTLSILEAARKHNPRISRIVITSSFASAIDPNQGMRPGYVYAEEDWNPVTKETAASGGAEFRCNYPVASPGIWTGDPPCARRDWSSLNTSSRDIYRLIDGSEKEVPDTSFWALADVQDVAEAHVRALEESAAAGQRYLIANSAYSYQQVCDIIRENFPQFHNLTPRGTPGARLPPVYKLDTSKAVHQLGMSFRPREETIVDTVESLRELHQ
ncbi:hypothetical protein PCL_02331 [Purpureocillium lilacinum]|uniref:NAD-dependent epimerase/dehydratase domain-containing protein n=1 Tax=Purpureocillium lilacinum TaxID=33203 RepID=A0A2U3E090_PURLI|nr:hypothetical protein PCL_02331 [Purpureocillium lilacinum]